MKVIHGKEQIALVLSFDELGYIVAGVGQTGDPDVCQFGLDELGRDPTLTVNGSRLYDELRGAYEDHKRK